MSASKTHRILTAALVTAIGLTTYMGAQGAGGRAASAPATAPAPTSSAALPPASADVEPNKPIAVINGMAINNDAFYGLLMQISGMKLFQQVFDLTLVQKACQISDVPFTVGPVDKDGKPTTKEGKDFQTRLEAELQHIKDQAAYGLAPADQDKVLSQLISQRGLTLVEFKMALERSAGLREMCKRAGGVTEPTAKEVQDAYGSLFGDQYVIWVFNVEGNDPGGSLPTALAELNANPNDVATKLKLPPPRGIKFPDNTTDPAFTEIVKRVRTLKPKDVTSTFSIVDNSATPPKTLLLRVWLQEKVASTQKEHPLTEVVPESKPPVTLQDKLKADLTETRWQNWMNNKLDRLRAEAVVTINDKVLSDQFQQAFANMQASTKPAATGTAPATGPATRP